ncbi:putative integral membrane protein [Streptomyces scabiei 87.22]|uniref:Putative integral membrane protein n=1 Tax=Streptomyces scabiei (strain 87.22) TaxID=680198 RepID=C9ZDN1_STRSW|nr:MULTISPECIES: hypothetical protein [Streptomyces]MBP5868323.1 hypothetical protein [Streptomyces sp. LBUM 1485]MBP5876828.1 hypothetical protein [Streptomyces sp. LBUM 1477]MBP5884610.1 hypothetical protein [Streptomyces sp. LBUM 1487]MBP5900569.1 hypothetical protein [Streptomyces sp. LBUM 1488]MBP5915800.1 hypothetical protein [Streptomyces sp. LBUM 1486]
MGFKGCTGFAEFTGAGGLAGFAGFKKAAVVAGAALALAVVGGQGSAQAQAPAQAQAQTQVRILTQVQRANVFGPVVDPIVERVCATPLPIRLPLCGEPGAGTDKPVNGWQVEKPKQ